MGYTLTSKSQVTLPKAIREHLRVAPGDAVAFRIVADGGVRVEASAAQAAVPARAVAAARKRFVALRGAGGQAGQGGSDAVMQHLRGYGEDANDPGFAPIKPARRR